MKTIIVQKERDSEDLSKKIDNVAAELNKYQKIIGSANKITDIDEFSQQKDFSYIITSEVGPLIFDFLEVEDILNIRLTSSFNSKAVKHLGAYGFLIARKLQQRFNQNKKQLSYQLGGFMLIKTQLIL